MTNVLIATGFLIASITTFILGYRRVFQADIITGLMYIALGSFLAFGFSGFTLE